MDGEIQRQLLDDDPTLREIVQRLADAYHPLRIYLFGSKARGTGNSDRAGLQLATVMGLEVFVGAYKELQTALIVISGS